MTNSKNCGSAGGPTGIILTIGPSDVKHITAGLVSELQTLDTSVTDWAQPEVQSFIDGLF
jgi:hypothetical protein